MTPWKNPIKPIALYQCMFFHFLRVVSGLLYWTILGGALGIVVSTAAFHSRVRGSVPGSRRFERNKNVSSPSTNFESCVWRTVSSQLSHHPQEVPLAQFSLYVHKGCLKPDSFHLLNHIEPSKYISRTNVGLMLVQRLRRWVNVKPTLA